MSIGKGMKKGQRTKTGVPSWLLLMEVSQHIIIKIIFLKKAEIQRSQRFYRN